MYDINSNILTKSGLSAEQLASAERAIRPDNGYSGFQMFVDAENKYGINALFILAHADIESAHATSFYAKTRNNLFGFNAVDSNPDEASSYPSQAASVDFYASFLKRYYLTPGAMYFNGDTAHGIFVKYSSSHDSEAQSVVGLMNLLASHVSSGGQPQPATAANHVQPQSSASVYVVKSGDTLWAIASAYHLSLARLLQLNPQIANPNLIHPGDRINVSGNQPAPAPTPSNTYTVVSGDNLSAIAAKFGTTWQQLYAWNKAVIGGNPDFIKPGEVLRVR